MTGQATPQVFQDQGGWWWYECDLSGEVGPFATQDEAIYAMEEYLYVR